MSEVPNGSRRRTTLRTRVAATDWDRLTLKGMAESVISTNKAGGIATMNAAAERLTGYLQRLGRPHGEILRVHDRGTGRRLASPLTRILAGANSAEFEERAMLTREDGTERFVEGTAAPLLDGIHLIGAVVTFRDVTTRRLEELEVSKLVEQLRESLRLHELFARILGHDLRNPLGSVVMSAQLLLRTGGEASATSARRILHSGRRMSRMIEQLLDFTRLRSSAGLPLRVTRMDLGTTCRAQVDELKQGHPGRAVAVDIRGDVTGMWDPDRLEQVLSTLVSNALQHGDPAEGVCVRIDGTEESTVVVEVENQGEVPGNVLSNLFDPFRSVQELRKKAQGLGLGLHIGQALVRLHGGSLIATSSGNRTTLTVRLPRTCGAILPHT